MTAIAPEPPVGTGARTIAEAIQMLVDAGLSKALANTVIGEMENAALAHAAASVAEVFATPGQSQVPTVSSKPLLKPLRKAGLIEPREETHAGLRRRRRAALVKRDGARCAYCGVPFLDPSLATLDHIIPYVITRTYDLWDLALACDSCNDEKGSRIPAVLVPLLKYLLAFAFYRNAAPVERSLVPVGGAR